MLINALLTIALAIVPPQGGGRGGNVATTDSPVLEVSARLIGADGQTLGSASKSGAKSFSGYVWSDAPCSLAAADQDPSKATIGWKFTANVESLDGAGFKVRLEWQRVWDQQRRVDSGTNAVFDRTMVTGERVQIDRVDVSTASRPCGTAIQLEVSVTRPSLNTMGFGAGGGRGMRPLAGGAPGGGTAGAAAQGGRGGRGVGFGGGGRGVLTLTTMYSAELWLVHTVPNRDDATVAGAATRGGRGTMTGARPSTLGAARASVPSEAGPNEHEEITYQTVRFPASGAGFALPPVTIDTGNGSLFVAVLGTLSARVENGVPTTLVVTVNRQTMNPGQPSGASAGSSTKEIPWPKNGEVISLELPPAKTNAQDPLAREKLAIRLRLGGLGGIARGVAR